MLVRTETLPPGVVGLLEHLPNYTELSWRQRQVLALAIQGRTSKEAAHELGVCEQAIKFHLGVARDMLHFKRLPQLQYRLILMAAEALAASTQHAVKSAAH